LKGRYDKLLSNFAFYLNLRHYSKAVVFSQLRDALAHAAEALTWEGIGCAIVGVKSGGGGGG